MQYIILLILTGIILLLAVFLLAQRKKEAVLQAQIKGLNEQLDKLTMTSSDRDALLQAANNIYLYAALSEEEALSRSLKEKQADILRASGTIIQIIQT